ncbi:hypothetical protein BDQ12DRAFT_727135 [Crucibulum laeve]|uniref:Ubiquitin-like protease family profile domain-containing protein n=1 Tax=Crucibulum laeve TaxID=68775 RepID=A0A5C3LQ10_9AGAR|nr:hypothetical protein BDQ12DRAFT_727135 [Crucibulum laeve]
MHDILDAQKSWKNAVAWLKQCTSNSAQQKHFRECHGLLATLGWNEVSYIPGSGTRTSFLLSGLLADKMVKGELLDMMVSYVSEVVERDEDIAEAYKVVKLQFMDTITKQWQNRNSDKPVQSLFLDGIKADTAKHPRSLLVPVHLPLMKHYVSFEINFKEKLICYGDSLQTEETTSNMQEIKMVYKQLQWWLMTNFGQLFLDGGCTLDRGIQRDSVSCAIALVNKFAFKIMDDSLWNVSRAAYERVLWFNRLAKLQIKDRDIPHNDSAISGENDHCKGCDQARAHSPSPVLQPQALSDTLEQNDRATLPGFVQTDAHCSPDQPPEVHKDLAERAINFAEEQLCFHGMYMSREPTAPPEQDLRSQLAFDDDMAVDYAHHADAGVYKPVHSFFSKWSNNLKASSLVTGKEDERWHKQSRGDDGGLKVDKRKKIMLDQCDGYLYQALVHSFILS